MKNRIPIGMVSLGLLAAGAGSLFGQTHKVAAPERVTRAVGVYEWTGGLAKPDAARLIPVSLFLEGRMEDAGVYLARPVPFVLQTGNVYSIDRAGEHLGTFDVDFARDVVTRTSANDDNPVNAWFGYGRFLLPAAEPRPPALKASAVQPVIVSSSGDSDDRPHFSVRQTSAPSPNTTSTAKSTPAAATPGPPPDDDPERPTLRRRDPKEDAAKDTKRKKKESDSGVFGPATSLNDDPSRPTMRRGVPAGAVTTAPLLGMPLNLHQAIAVSDVATREAHIFTRVWESSSERAEVLAAMQALARPRVTNYITVNKLKAVAAAPVATAVKASGPSFASKPASAMTSASSGTTARSSTAGRPRAGTKTASPLLALTGEQLLGYTLSYGGLPTFVYTAETPVADGGPVYATLVAQRLPSGEIQIALSSITDATHLNRVPWMRPVDAVDPDAGHRASLLFELRAQSSRQFALYRLITAQAEQTFATGVIQ